jgi:multisubunit Na+/H+ antiporter MnhB subunit
MEKNIITIILFDFLIAVAVGIAAAAIAAFILANAVIGLFKRS